jgi:hypothetical protein
MYVLHQTYMHGCVCKVLMFLPPHLLHKFSSLRDELGPRVCDDPGHLHRPPPTNKIHKIHTCIHTYIHTYIHALCYYSYAYYCYCEGELNCKYDNKKNNIFCSIYIYICTLLLYLLLLLLGRRIKKLS